MKFLPVILLISTLTSTCFSQSKQELADYLMKDHDYFRAISVYKELYFYSQNADLQNYCLLQIAYAYWKSNKYKSSIQFLTRLLNRPSISSYYRDSAMIYMALNYYNLRLFSTAEDYLQKITSDTSGRSLYYLTLLEVEKGNFENASETYKKIYNLYPDQKIGTISNELSNYVLNGLTLKQKKPILAILFSTVLPGSGQFYCQHHYDGIQAFLYVSAFAFATYASYRYDKKFSNNYASTLIAFSITGLFHIGNIIGAGRTAKYYNLKQKQNFMNQIRKKVFSIED